MVLKHDAPIGMRAGDVTAVEADAAGAEGQMSCDGPQQRRLAASRGAEEADELLGRDVEVDVLDDVEGGGSSSEPDHATLQGDVAADGARGLGHRAPPRAAQGVSRDPIPRTSRLDPIPSSPINSMPTTMLS